MDWRFFDSGNASSGPCCRTGPCCTHSHRLNQHYAQHRQPGCDKHIKLLSPAIDNVLCNPSSVISSWCCTDKPLFLSRDSLGVWHPSATEIQSFPKFLFHFSAHCRSQAKILFRASLKDTKTEKIKLSPGFLLIRESWRVRSLNVKLLPV